MRYRIRSLEPMSVGKMFAALYFCISLLFVPFLLIIMISMPQQDTGGRTVGVALAIVMMIILPLLYGAMGFIFGALGAVVYNLVAGWLGGFVMELQPAGIAPELIPQQPPYPLVPPSESGSAQ